MNSASVNALKTKIKNIEQQIKTKIEQTLYLGMTYVIIIGKTGSGKSSLTSCLANKKVTICQGKGSNVYLDGDGIFSGCQSGTKEPSIVIDHSSKIIICDCPGFDDTDGYYQEIINSFIIDYLFKITPNKKIKILLVISAAQFESYRGQSVLQSIDMMIKMFPNPNELEKIIGLVVTKGETELNGIDYINQLELGKNDGENITNAKKWFNFFEINNDRVFLFPKALRSDIGKNYNFYDCYKLHSFLKTSSQITNISHNAALSENATTYLLNMKNDLIQNVTYNCRNIFYTINNVIRNVNNSYEYNDWINKMNQLSSLFINNIQNLIDFFNQKIPNSFLYNSYFENLKNLEVLNDFISKIIDGYTNSSILMNVIKTLTTETISDLKYKYNQLLIYEENERKRIEYEILMEKKRKEEEIRQKNEEEIRKKLEIQQQEEEKQKKKEEILNTISIFQTRSLIMIREGFPSRADYYAMRIGRLRKALAKL